MSFINIFTQNNFNVNTSIAESVKAYREIHKQVKNLVKSKNENPLAFELAELNLSDWEVELLRKRATRCVVQEFYLLPEIAFVKSFQPLQSIDVDGITSEILFVRHLQKTYDTLSSDKGAENLANSIIDGIHSYAKELLEDGTGLTLNKDGVLSIKTHKGFITDVAQLLVLLGVIPFADYIGLKSQIHRINDSSSYPRNEPILERFKYTLYKSYSAELKVDGVSTEDFERLKRIIAKKS